MINDSTGRVYVGVVDDDESMRRSLQRLLRAAGYCPIAYESAADFFGDLKHPDFDCLILDVQLNAISGIELAQQLSDSGKRCLLADKFSLVPGNMWLMWNMHFKAPPISCKVIARAQLPEVRSLKRLVHRSALQKATNVPPRKGLAIPVAGTT